MDSTRAILLIFIVGVLEAWLFTVCHISATNYCQKNDCNNSKHDADLRSLVEKEKEFLSQRRWELTLKEDDGGTGNGHNLEKAWNYQKGKWEEKSQQLEYDYRLCNIRAENNCESIHAEHERHKDLVVTQTQLEFDIGVIRKAIGDVNKIIKSRNSLLEAWQGFAFINSVFAYICTASYAARAGIELPI